MDMNVSRLGIPQIGPEKPVMSTAQEELPKEPVDNVEQCEKGHGFAYKTLRGFAKVVGGVAGVIPGAATGAVKGAAIENPHEILGPKATKLLRAAGAGTGLILGGLLGAANGPLGFAVGIVAGPIIGTALVSAVPGAFDGAYAAGKGAVKGSWDGMKKGAEIAGKFVDWIASKFESSPAPTNPPPPAEEPKPSQQALA